MTLDADFNRIRSLDDGQRGAFEEFCAQLARRDDRVPAGARFVRLRGAGGDGGVECYWTLPNGTEWGWQAKYLVALDKSQIESSFRTALAIHPELRRYVVCLPLDLTGPTGRRGASQVERWAQWATDGQAEAAARGRTVEIELWGRSELLDRLVACDPSGGRALFWFDELRFGVDWFERQIDDAVRDAGPRYHPELNIAVPLAEVLEAVGRTPAWATAWRRCVREISREVDGLARWLRDRPADAEAKATELASVAADAARAAVARLELVLEGVDDHEAALEDLDVARDRLRMAEAALRAEIEERHGAGAADNASFRQFHAEYLVAFPTAGRDYAARLGTLTEQARERLAGPGELAGRGSALLVTGIAGSGKTHAMCDAARQRLSQKLLSVLVLCQRLDGTEVWDQVRRILGLDAGVGRDALLAALDAAAEASGYPLLLLVDALNERKPRSAWRDELASFVAQVARYPGLRLVLTCRTAFVGSVVPDTLVVPSVEHLGFSGVEFEAAFAFFSHFGLVPPGIPLLEPEYSNPLFLRQLCIGLSGTGRTSLEERPLSLSEVTNLLLEGAEPRAARELDVDVRDRLVHRAVHLLAGEMCGLLARSLSWARAHELVDGLLPGRPQSQSLLQFLIADALLIEVESPGVTAPDRIAFAYERLGDHLIVSRVLDDSRSADGAVGGEAAAVAAVASVGDPGLNEAAALLAPERLGAELPDLAPEHVRDAAMQAFLVSLPWRAEESLSVRAVELLEEALAQGDTSDLALDQVISLAARPGHPLGGEFLDGVLRRLPCTERDAVMCRYLHFSWERNGPARRLTEWASRPNLGPVSESTAFAWCRTLAWFCLAADRRVRDHETMGIVAVAARQPRSVCRLLASCLNIDDEYIVERVLLATYGSLVRSADGDWVADAALQTWRQVFAPGPPTNALIRDHARLVIELAVERQALPAEVHLHTCRPPYGVPWPPDWPSADEAATAPAEVEETVGPALRRLRTSVRSDDFATYTMTSALRTHARPDLDMAAAKGWILREVERMGFRGELFDAYDGGMLYRYGDGRGRPSWAERIGKKYQWIGLYRLVGLVDDNFPVEPRTSEGGVATPAVAPLQAPGERNLDPTVLIRRRPTSRPASASIHNGR